MKYWRLILFVLLTAGLFGCPPHKPPVTPPPVPVCGNAICEVGETAASCPADCKPTPECDRDGKCEAGETQSTCADCQVTPPPACDESNPVGDPDCKPKTRDHSQTVMLGMYVGATGQPDFDSVALFKLFRHFNWLSLHGMSPWDNDCFYFLELEGGSNAARAPLSIGEARTKLIPDEPVSPPSLMSRAPSSVGGKYLTKKPNLKWQAHIERIFMAAAYYDVGIEWKFFDVYGDPKWMQYDGYGCRVHPLRDNDARVDLTVDSSRPLLKNWNHQDFSNPKNWAWMFPRTDAKDNILSYEGTNALGDAILTANMEFIADLVVKVRKIYPNFRFRVSVANEAFGVTDAGCSPGSKCGIDPGKSNEIDSRTEKLLERLFITDRKLKRGENFQIVYEATVHNAELIRQERTREGPDTLDPFWTRKNTEYIGEIRGLYEIHSIDDASEVATLKTLTGSLKDVIPSSDGSPEDSTFHKRMNGIYKMMNADQDDDFNAFDFKVWACYKKGPDCPKPWSSSMMNNLHFVERMEKEIFQ